MSTLDIYDPPQCCATGACGPDADDELAQFASALEGLKQNGVAVSRYNLGHQPGAFVQNAMVKGTIDKEGIACLPMVIADGVIVAKGRYPTRDELGKTVGAAKVAAPAATSCCAPAPKDSKPCCG
ncbi:MAG TPA: arsenite efflux transporter metallochaperone ArsD [Usitatibacter sp.]|nr:arsenite efflux transporter metallochaperone ArsD [Usitatibacter sp.]